MTYSQGSEADRQRRAAARWWLVAFVTWVVWLGGDLQAQVSFDAVPADTTVLCPYVPPMSNPPASSSCPGPVSVTATQDTIDRACVNKVKYELVRTYVAEDRCGARTTHTQRITVFDDRRPIISGVPGNQTVTPDAVPPPPNPTVIDFCDPDAYLLSTVRDSLPGPCGGYTLYFRFEAVDACNNRDTVEYVLSVSSQNAPTFSDVPPGRTLTCNEPLPAAPAVTATNNAGESIPVVMSVDTIYGQPGDPCLLIERTWTATDACNLQATTQQSYSVEDDVAPVLAGVPADTTVYCEALPPMPIVTATDDCDGTWEVTPQVLTTQSNDGSCTDVNYVVIRRWTAVDDCGNTTVREQRIAMKCECCDNGIDDDDDGLVDDYDPHCNCFAGVVDECDNTRRYFIPPVWHPTREQYRQPSELVITTLAPTANIHIQTADGTSYNQTFVVNRGNPLIIPLDAPGTTIDYLQTPNHDQIERDRGWIITSDQLIQPIYRIDGFFNKVLVTVKGPQGMGRVFRAGSQTSTCGTNNMGTGEGHFISVMATEDNTEVTIDYDFPALNGLVGPVTRTLQRYETYLIRDDVQNTTVSGSLITATKPIVVMSGSQHTKACAVDAGPPVRQLDEVAQGMDGGIDQLVPNCLTGDEYVLVKGAGSQQQQYAILVANKNNTRIIQDGDPNTEIVLQAGEHESVYLVGPDYSPTHFQGNKPFYMFHVSGISTNNEVGMAIAAPVGECKGDTLIEFPRFSDANTTTPVRNSVYTILPATGLPSLTVNGNPWSSCATAQPVPSRPDLRVVVFQDNCLLPSNSITSDEFFTAGMLVGINTETGTHGYLTAFKDRMSVFDPNTRIETTGYLVDTLCGDQTVSHCIDVASCATEHTIAAVRGGAGRVRLLGGTCFEYTSPDQFQGEDEVFVTVKNDQGLFQTVCIRYYICAEPPVVQFPFTDTTVTCEAIPPLTNPQAADECGMNVFFDAEEVVDDGTCAYAYVLYRHWTIWDDCGDSTRATQTIRVADTTAPQSLTIRDDTIRVYCGLPPPPPTIDFTENCDDDFTVVYEQVTLDSLCPYEKTLERRWQATDNCGNVQTAVHRIEVRDTIGPRLQIIPPSVEIACGQTAAQPSVLLTEGCDPNAVITRDSVIRSALCDTVLFMIRTWTATDACGRVATASQTVVVRDLDGPQASNVPADVQLRCGEALPTDAPDFVDDCTTPLVVVQADSSAPGGCPELEVIYRTWTTQDDCGRVATASQRISYVDLDAPVITPFSTDTIQGSCSDTITFPEPTFADDCDFRVLRRDSIYSADCQTERYVWRHFTAIDSCGNFDVLTQLYFFADTVPPIWVNAPRDTVLTCGEPIPPIRDLTIVDACSGINPIGVEVRDSAITCPATRWLFRSYTVSDWCGNLDTFVHTIQINNCEPEIPALATGQAGCIGEDITLTASIDSGYATPVYRWEFSPDGTTYTALSQPADSTTLTIVNADASRSGFYRVVVANAVAELADTACSSVSAPIDLTLSSPTSSSQRVDLCRGDTLFYLGDTLTRDTLRVDTLQTTAGCDSVATLELAVYPFVEQVVDTTLCFGDSLVVFGTTYKTSGSFRDTLITAYGCDTTIALDLTVLPDLRDTTRGFLCEGEDYVFEGVSHAAAGVYTFPLTSVDGCDSTKTLLLTAVDTIRTVIDTTVCFGQPVSAFGQSFDATGVYTGTLTSYTGCDSIVVLDLEVVDSAATRLSVTLCEGDQYFFGDRVLTEAGSYRRVFTSSLGCDSAVVADVVLSPRYEREIREELCEGEIYENQNYSITEPGRWPLRFYTADGCDSTVYVTLVFRPTFDQDIEATICRGEPYQLFDTLIYDAGVYQDTGLSRFGCDSLVRLTLSVADPSEHTIDTALCDGGSLLVGGQRYSASVRDTLTLTNAVGCDSTIFLDLLVYDSPNFDTTALICHDETFDTGGRSYNETGVYSDTSSSARGCDSIYTVYLTVVPERRDTLEESICAGDTLTLPDGSTWADAGEYELIFPTPSGCDSTLILMLEVRDTARTEVFVEVCAGTTYEVDGLSFDREDVYTYKLLTASGCDSTIVLDLVHVEPTYAEAEATVCAGDVFPWRGRELTTTGVYRDTLRSRLDCDSVIAIDITFYQPATTREPVEICEGESYTVDGVPRTVSGDYPQVFAGYLGCDSTHVIELEVIARVATYDTLYVCPGEVVSFNGADISGDSTFAALLTGARGCDSTAYLTLIEAEPVTIEVFGGLLCRGDALTLRTETNGQDVVWSPAQGLSCVNCAKPLATPDSTTVYTATVLDCYGDPVTDTAIVRVAASVDVEIVSDRRLRLGESAKLIGTTDNPLAGLRWTAGGLDICEGCPELVVTPTETTTYELSGQTDEGCVDRAQLTLVVEDDCAFSEVKVPNVITPNDDGINDVLEIRYEGVAEVSLLRIFNRWGEMVFETRNIDEFWDGTHRGVPLNPAVFMYYLEGRCIDDESFVQEGNVTLVR